MDQTEASSGQVQIVSYVDEWWYHNRYHTHDLSYFILFLIFFVCVYIVLGSYMWKSRAVCHSPNQCQEPQYHYVVIDVHRKTEHK
jgi:hypothetical protein